MPNGNKGSRSSPKLAVTRDLGPSSRMKMAQIVKWQRYHRANRAHALMRMESWAQSYSPREWLALIMQPCCQTPTLRIWISTESSNNMWKSNTRKETNQNVKVSVQTTSDLKVEAKLQRKKMKFMWTNQQFFRLTVQARASTTPNSAIRFSSRCLRQYRHKNTIRGSYLVAMLASETAHKTSTWTTFRALKKSARGLIGACSLYTGRWMISTGAMRTVKSMQKTLQVMWSDCYPTEAARIQDLSTGMQSSLRVYFPMVTTRYNMICISKTLLTSCGGHPVVLSKIVRCRTYRSLKKLSMTKWV